LTTETTGSQLHPPKRPRFFCYIRFSSKPQEDGDSERRQLANGTKRATESDADFVDAYTDRGLSGHSGANRDGDLGRMIEDVDAGRIEPGDIIWVENHDRLTRRPPLEAIEQFIRFLNAGIVLDINGHSRTKEILNKPSGFGLLV
jgi:DNA invertase Pin-like site-specific DNA recombinase